MTAEYFVDTNVLLYAASNSAADQPKRVIAREILARTDIGFSAQVMQEFYSAAIAKKHLQMTHDEALAVLKSLATFPICPVTAVLEAIDRKVRFGISYWDAAITTAATKLASHTVFSEDLNAVQIYDGVKVVNPF
jgi:predicted nucleic acid-binding protein